MKRSLFSKDHKEGRERHSSGYEFFAITHEGEAIMGKVVSVEKTGDEFRSFIFEVGNKIAKTDVNKLSQQFSSLTVFRDRTIIYQMPAEDKKDKVRYELIPGQTPKVFVEGRRVGVVSLNYLWTTKTTLPGIESIVTTGIIDGKMIFINHDLQQKKEHIQ